LAIGKMINGLLSEPSSTMVLPPGQKMGPGAIAPLYICSMASSGCRLLLKLQELSICWQNKALRCTCYASELLDFRLFVGF
jgi:hypothetical protein